jgi:hypothetical protein
VPNLMNYINAMVGRGYDAVGQVRKAVEEHWQRSHTGGVPLGRSVAELAADAALAAGIVSRIALLETLLRELVIAANNIALRGPGPFWEHWYLRREMRKGVRVAERSARDIVALLGMA